jgi:hypothetical protein
VNGWGEYHDHDLSEPFPIIHIMSLLQSGTNALADSDIPTIFTPCCFEGMDLL